MKPTNASAHMNDSGYVIFPSEEIRRGVEDVRQTICALLRDLCGVNMDIADSFRAVFDADVNRYLTIVRALPRLRAVRQLVYASELSQFLRAELGYQCPMEPSEPVVHIQGDHLRIPGGYFGYKGHQDMSAFGDVPKLTTIWIPIFDVMLDTFPLEIAIGRHRSGVLEYVPADQVYAIPTDVVEDAAYVPIELKVGSALLLDGHLPHRSGPGGAGAFRLAFSYRIVEASDAAFFARRFQYSDPGAQKT